MVHSRIDEAMADSNGPIVLKGLIFELIDDEPQSEDPLLRPGFRKVTRTNGSLELDSVSRLEQDFDRCLDRRSDRIDPTALIESFPVWHGLDLRSLLAANKDQVMTFYCKTSLVFRPFPGSKRCGLSVRSFPPLNRPNETLYA